MAKKFQTHFHQWKLNQRYFNRSDAVFDAATTARQKQGAEGLRGLLQQVQQGLL